MNHSTKLPDCSALLQYDETTLNTDADMLWVTADEDEAVFLSDTLDIAGLRLWALIDAGGYDALAQCSKFFDAFKTVFIVIRDKATRDDVARVINESVVSACVLTVSDAAWRGCKSVSEFRNAHGADNLRDLCNGLRELPNPALLNVADIKPVQRAAAIISGISGLDSGIGGFYHGELNVWTGKRGSGKTTLVNNLLLDAIGQGERVCVYSGELTPDRLRDWHLLQAAGAENVTEQVFANSGKTYYSVPQPIQRDIDEWWNLRMFYYDTRRFGVNAEDEILSLMKRAEYRYGCRVFVLDNLMTVQLNENRNFNQAQTRFITRLAEFARQKDAIIHLVAHPRKTGRGEEPEADDVAGIADITNLADNVFRVSRLSNNDATGANAKIKILKNRAYGKLGDVLLKFDTRSRRYSDMDGAGLSRRYGWEPQQTGFENLRNVDLPEGWS